MGQITRSDLDGAVCGGCEADIPDDQLDFIATDPEGFFLCQGCGSRGYRLTNGANLGPLPDE